jgi:hypothetical protein
MRRSVWGAIGLAAVALGAPPVLAQDDDPMELQRCIWRCLADSPGAASPEYNACVERQCTAESPAPAWTTGVTADGAGRFAGTTDPETDSEFHFVCWPVGQSYLMLTGPEGPDAVLPVTVAGQTYAVPFTSYGGYHMAAIPVDSPIIAGIWQGGTLVVGGDTNPPLGTFGLDGAPLAIHTAWQGCQ